MSETAETGNMSIIESDDGSEPAVQVWEKSQNIETVRNNLHSNFTFIQWRIGQSATVENETVIRINAKVLRRLLRTVDGTP